ncbi:LysM peptidoglycan-binding domain-containing protein [Desulfurobacterium sp.]
MGWKRFITTIAAVSVILPASAYCKKNIYKINIIKVRKAEQETGKHIIYYKVKPGDTLYGILKKYGLPLKMIGEVVKLNKIKNPNLILKGQVLKIPLPGVKTTKKRQKFKISSKVTPDFSPVINGKGSKIYKNGMILLNSGTINLKQNPVITVGGNNYIIDLNNNLTEEEIKELQNIGYKVVKNEKQLRKLVEENLLNTFGSFEANGTIKLGIFDKLTYHYDYLIYDMETGSTKIFNMTPDTPKELRNLLAAYGITVEQPKIKVERGNPGIVKILTGTNIEKITELIHILTGEKAVKDEDGYSFNKLKIFVVKEMTSPEEITKKKMAGFTIVKIYPDMRKNIREAVNAIPFAIQKIKLIIVEPPGTDGKRSRFEIKGFSIDTPENNYFVIPGVEKPEEIPYMVSRGVNLIIY